MGKNNRRGSGRGTPHTFAVTFTATVAGKPIQSTTELTLVVNNPHGREGAIREAKPLIMPELMAKTFDGEKPSNVNIDHVKLIR